MGSNLCGGKTLSEYIHLFFGVEIGERQCQRMLRELGFRYRKPRPMIARLSKEEEAFTKA